MSEELTGELLWTRDCPGYTVAEVLDGQVQVSCLVEAPDPVCPRVPADLHLWRFEEGSGSSVRDLVGEADLAAEGGYAWLEGGGLRLNDGSRLLGALLDGLVSGTQKGLSLEVWCQPGADSQHGRVLSWAESKTALNLELRQAADSWAVYCRGAADGKPPLVGGSAVLDTLYHLVWSWSFAAGTESFYRNGQKTAEGGRWLGSFDNVYPLLLGNVLAGDRQWVGDLHLVALYGWALSAAEARANYDLGPHPEKVAPEEPEPASLVEALRGGAWLRAGVSRNEGAAFLRKARAASLGAPLTAEWDFSFGGVDYRAQGFAGAVVYCQLGDWGNVQELDW